MRYEYQNILILVSNIKYDQGLERDNSSSRIRLCICCRIDLDPVVGVLKTPIAPYSWRKPGMNMFLHQIWMQLIGTRCLSCLFSTPRFPHRLSDTSSFPDPVRISSGSWTSLPLSVPLSSVGFSIGCGLQHMDHIGWGGPQPIGVHNLWSMCWNPRESTVKIATSKTRESPVVYY